MMVYTEQEMLLIAFGEHEGYKSIDEFQVDEFSGGYAYYYSVVVEIKTGDFYKITWKSHGHNKFEGVCMEQVWASRMVTTVWKTINDLEGF